MTDPFMHPYRFVFICGCNSANTDLPLAFGIPKVKGMSSADFTKKYRLTPRAFLGFAAGEAFKVGDDNKMNENLKDFLETFWRVWTQKTDGNRHTLKEAVDAGVKACSLNWVPLLKIKVEPVIYGCYDLTFDE